MSALRSTSWKLVLATGILLTLFLGVIGCGGGDGGTTATTVPTATIQGSVSGTIVMAIDETGKIVDQDDTAGKTPLPGSSPPKYPFTLNVPVGHQYTIQFIVGEGTTGEKMVPLYEGTTNIFSVTSSGKLDLGFVDTSAATAASDNNILTQGVTSGGATGDNTISLARPGWGYKYVTYLDDSDGSVKTRFQVEIRDPSGTSPVTNKSLVRGVAFFDNAWNEYPLNGAFQLWDGSGVQYDSTGTIAPRPMTEVRGILQAAPSSLSERFYNVVVTDNAGNTHTAKVYFRQPDIVSKASNLAQVIHTDNSISLSWTNPTFPAGSKYGIWVAVLSNDGNGDGIDDTLLLAQRIPPVSSYTLPPAFVATLAGKGGLKWAVQIRQYDDTTVFPDGSIPGIGNQIYRNYSAEKILTLPTPPLAFTDAMLRGKVFFELNQSVNPVIYNLFYFNTDGTFRNENEEAGPTSSVLQISTGTWSIDGAGRAIAAITSVTSSGPEPPGPYTVTVTLLADTANYMDVQVEQPGETIPLQRLEKTFPFDPAKIPGTYFDAASGRTSIFNANGTGSSSEFGSFTWSVASGVLLIDAPGLFKNAVYSLAGTVSGAAGYQTIVFCGKDMQPDGTLSGLFRGVINRVTGGGGFTPAMLSGKVFFSEFSEQAGFVSNLLFFNTDGSLRVDLTDDVGTETLTGSWSINSAGQAIANIQGAISTVTLLSDSSTGMTVSVVEGTGPPQEQVLQKTVPIDASKLPGTYRDDFLDTNTFNAGGTGNNSFWGNFTWSVSGGKLTIVWVDAGGSSTELYALASSTSTSTTYTTLRTGSKDIEAGQVVWVYSWMFTRQ